MKAYSWRGGIYPHSFLAFALRGGEWAASRRGRFSPRKKSHSINWLERILSGHCAEG